MSKRSLTWLRQHTNVEDLLDDGIENNSDLGSFSTTERPSGKPLGPEPVELPLQALNIEPPEPEPAKQDFFVAAIGVLVMGCGLLLVLYPVDLMVYHDRGKYPSRDFLEHVTAGRSEMYGSVGILLGLALLIYALCKPRK